eukprot:scaffold10681_cov71-Phaeocystis_antarctica.AAC.3
MLVEGADLKCVTCLRWSSEYPAGPSRRMWGPSGSLPAVLMWRTTIAYHRPHCATVCTRACGPATTGGAGQYLRQDQARGDPSPTSPPPAPVGTAQC